MTRSSFLWQPVVASMLSMVVLAGCNSSKSASSTTTTVAPSATIPSAVPDDLRLTVFDRLPANFIEAPAGSEGDGPLGLV